VSGACRGPRSSPLVLDPRVRYSGGGGLDERHDRGQQLGGLFLEPVQADVHDVWQVEERRHLFGPASVTITTVR
jgi:hypothetical protein